MCVFSSHLFWTPSSLDVPAGVTQEEGHTGFLIHLPSAVRAFIFLARRILPFISLVDREVEFCVLTLASAVVRWVPGISSCAMIAGAADFPKFKRSSAMLKMIL